MPSACYSLPGVIRSQYKRRGVIATLTLTLLCRLCVLWYGRVDLQDFGPIPGVTIT